MKACLLLVVALAACKDSSNREIISKLGRTAEVPASPAPPEGTPAKRGSVHQESFVSWGIIPRTCTAEQAQKKARELLADPKIHIEVSALDQLGWEGADKTKLEVRAAAGDAALIDKFKQGVVLGAMDAPTRTGELATAVLAVATECKGWVLSMNNGTVYDVENATSGLPLGVPDARKIISLQAGKGDNELAYINSLGMNTVGLPELQLRGIPTTELKESATLMNAAAQALIDQDDVTRDGELDVDASKLRGDWHLDVLTKSGGSGKLTWKVRWVNADEDGNKLENPALQLIPPGTDASGAVALMAAMDTYFGKHEDKAVHLDEMRDDLTAAGVKARAALKKLLPHFRKGIPPREQLSVKAPFDTDTGGTEWMWVDIFKVGKGVIEGTLNNDPNEVAHLKSGAHVKVKFDEIADFIYRKEGEKSAGGFSLEVMKAHGMDVPALDD
ncbi:hypothetical protein BH11MYX2_BH11MYX2_11330 [soil metagenome]